MIKYLLLFLLPLSLFASKILSYNIYERTDRTDVMITFDTPYSGTIKQSVSDTKIVVKLQGASIESSKIKKVSSDFLHSLAITRMKGQTQIVASIEPSVKLVASKTSDAYGLRLRFTNAPTLSKTPVRIQTKQNALVTKGLPTKKGGDMSRSYYIVVGILILGISILLVLKNKMQKQKIPKPKDSWLFKSTQEKSLANETKEASSAVSIRFQKSINDTNSVVMLDFGSESYLVLMGNSNILLDKFSEDIPTNQEEFETILQSRHEELESFLGDTSHNGALNSKKEPLQAYKERAASLAYGDS